MMEMTGDLRGLNCRGRGAGGGEEGRIQQGLEVVTEMRKREIVKKDADIWKREKVKK